MNRDEPRLADPRPVRSEPPAFPPGAVATAAQPYGPAEPTDSAGPAGVSSGRLRALLWAVAAGLGVVYAWAAAVRHRMNEDGISYLDLGDAFARGDWDLAINAVWSPLYPLLLGFAIRLLDPAPAWEFPVVHAVNLLVYLFAIACFDFFWREVARPGEEDAAGHRADAGDASLATALPHWVWLLMGYALFLWTSLALITVWAVTPDMLVAAFVFLAAGLILRMRRDGAGWGRFALVGMVLGLGYLAKAVMFPLAVAFLAACFRPADPLPRGARRMTVALLAFLLVAGPWLSALSFMTGRPTFGESGRLTYAWHVNRIPMPHWQGQAPDQGMLRHPTRMIAEDVPVYEFATPIGGTYPVWFDPSYWYEGVSPRFDLRQQAAALASTGRTYFQSFFRLQGGMIVAALILYLAGRRRWPWALRDLASQWPLLVPALAAMAMYSLVYVEGRYIAPFITILWAGVLRGVRLPRTPDARRLAMAAGGAFLLVIAVNLTAFNLRGWNAFAAGGAPADEPGTEGAAAHAPPLPWQTAEAMWRSGLRPGDGVAYIGYSFGAYWARLARIRIVAEVPFQYADRFWAADRATRSRILERLATTGAKAVVVEPEFLPAGPLPDGWRPVENTGFHRYDLGGR